MQEIHIRKSDLWALLVGPHPHCLLILPEAGPGQGWQVNVAGVLVLGSACQMHSPHAVSGSLRVALACLSLIISQETRRCI